MVVRKAKIVCTIGPASEDADVLDRLVASGMNVARLNFSHGSHESHGRAIKAIRAAAERRNAALAIIQDLQGPRIRVGALPPDGLEVKADERVVLITGLLRSGGQLGLQAVTPPPYPPIPVTYPHLVRDLRPGARILIDNGLIELTANRIAGDRIECTVVAGGRLTSNKGINLPGTTVSSPSLTDKDREDLRFGLDQRVDYIALSFVRGPEDIKTAKALVAEYGGAVPVIAKIERAEAVANLDAILDEADGVMIARGDLGVEVEPEAVPVIQKRIIAGANRRRRLVITATQMLESMTLSRRPTRAEASDVANAVFDGTDAVMLSGETAIGQYPVEVVRIMDRIIRAAEEAPGAVPPAPAPSGRRTVSVAEAVCEAASAAASAVDAKTIVAFSEAGTTALLISKQRPAVPIMAFTPFEPVRRRMALYWGVVSYTLPEIDQTDERLQAAERHVKAEGLAAAGQRIVILSGTRIGQPGGTNLMKVQTVE